MYVGGAELHWPRVMVNGMAILPVNQLELLGIRVDKHLSAGPYLDALAADTARRAVLVARLACHLPKQAGGTGGGLGGMEGMVERGWAGAYP